MNHFAKRETIAITVTRLVIKAKDAGAEHMAALPVNEIYTLASEYFPVVKCNNSCPWAGYGYRKETTTPQTHLPHAQLRVHTCRVNPEKERSGCQRGAIFFFCSLFSAAASFAVLHFQSKV